ncbi:MAG: DUF523 domain-containing protein [Desulfopila sp.]
MIHHLITGTEPFSCQPRIGGASRHHAEPSSRLATSSAERWPVDLPSKPSLVSSCLLGLCTRYDGCAKPHNDCICLLERTLLIPVCPEQLGGLPTPRERSTLIGDGHEILAGKGRVKSASGSDVTDHFIRGAHMTLKIAELTGATSAILKAKSPSCGVSGIIGVAAALLQSAGITLIEY